MTQYRLKLPYTRPPAALWGNARHGHWGARSRDSKNVRHAVMTLARTAKIPQTDHLTVELVYAPGDRRRRDEDNLVWMLKACCDGLARGPRKQSTKAANWIGLDLVPDDTPKYMTKRARILSPEDTDEVGMWLIITTGREDHGPLRRDQDGPERQPA